MAILGYDLWQRRYHADPTIVGRTVEADGKILTVVGVLPKGAGIVGERFDLWLPRLFECTTLSRESIERGAGILTMIGRLRPGINLTQANQRLVLVPTDPSGTAAGRKEVGEASVESLEEAITGNVRLNLLVVWGAAAAASCSSLART